MIETITYKGESYPKFQAEGFAAKFAFPYALQVCHGTGYDIGPNRPEWKFPGAIAVDPAIDPAFDAMHLPEGKVDYVFSSHCGEHLSNYVEALDYWHTKMKIGATLFLYLPDYSQVYWRPWNNRKHVHVLSPQIIRDYLTGDDRGNKWTKIFVSGVDLNNSFMAMAQKHNDA